MSLWKLLAELQLSWFINGHWLRSLSYVLMAGYSNLLWVCVAPRARRTTRTHNRLGIASGDRLRNLTSVRRS